MGAIRIRYRIDFDKGHEWYFQTPEAAEAAYRELATVQPPVAMFKLTERFDNTGIFVISAYAEKVKSYEKRNSGSLGKSS